VDDPSPVVGEHDEDEKDAQARGGDGADIEGDQVPDVIGAEGPPGLGRRGESHARAEISGCAKTALQVGRGLGPAKASGARHRPTSRRREHGRAQRGEDDHQGTGKPGTGPD